MVISTPLKLLRIILISLVLTVSACSEKSAQTKTGTPAETDGKVRSEIFVDQSTATGLDFQHYSGAFGKFHMPEIIGSGVALFDYDADGDLDVFLVQSTDIEINDSLLVSAPIQRKNRNRLFASQLIETGELKFIDVSLEVGLVHEMYGMGVAVSDVDNDGDQDLYVTAYGPNFFYKNDGGKFVAQINTAGANDRRWSTSASFCDVNNDSWPDLYVANYVTYRPASKVVCRDTLGQEDYCSPDSYKPVFDRLFINNRDGTFADASDVWGVSKVRGTGLGVLCRDLNNDGFQDIYVANDSMANFMWINQGAESFVEQADLLGAAINMNGLTEGSMGITAGDFDFDGDDDLFMTHWNNETNTIYRNDKNIGFMDITNTVNLATPSLAHTGFGTSWIDFDNDGDLDLFVANGAVQRYLDASGILSSDYGQPNQVFENVDGKRFVDVTAHAGSEMQLHEAGRGAAFGDIDNDGDTDVVVTSKDGPARLFVNTIGQNSHWLGLELQRTAANRDAVGAVVTVELEDGRKIRRIVHRDGSYQSASDPRIIIGLGNDNTAKDVTVHWPVGDIQTWSDLQTDRYHRLIEN